MIAKELKTGDALYQVSPSEWSLAGLSGRLVEITGAGASAVLTAALSLVRLAQAAGETTAWITPEESLFFPPDAAEAGVDLDALVIVRAPEPSAMKAADKLARSGAFGLIAVDLPPQRSRPFMGRPPETQGRDGWLSRLLGLARRHDIAILFLTQRESPPLGSLVSLRGESQRVRVAPDQYQVQVRIVKDKRRSPGWRHQEQYRGPAGLC